jgi:DNA-binding transcriptional LysR family regulator
VRCGRPSSTIDAKTHSAHATLHRSNMQYGQQQHDAEWGDAHSVWCGQMMDTEALARRGDGLSAGDRPPPVSAKLSDGAWGAIDLNLLIVFDALMRERNLTRAGRLLGLSQPATSHALARLRQMLHDDLFIRSPEGMQPTPRAQQMAEPIRDALRVLRLTLEPEEFDVARSTRGFSMVVNNYAARAIVPTLARKVGESAPNVSLDIRPVGMADVLVQLDAGGADVALAQLVDGGERFKCVRVTDDDYVVILDKAHPAAQEPSISIERFVEIPHVVITSSGDDTSFVDRALEERGFARKVATRVPFLSIVLMLVGADRLSILPRRSANGLSLVCPLVVRELPFPSPRITLSMIWHRRLDNQPAQRWLRGMIRASVVD